MVGVPADRERQDDHPGCEVPDLRDYEPTRLLRILEMGVGKTGIPPLGHTKDFGGPTRLLGPELGAAAGRGLSGRQVEDPGAVASIHRLEQGAGAGELDVIAVGGDGQDVYGHGGSGEDDEE